MIDWLVLRLFTNQITYLVFTSTQKGIIGIDLMGWEP